MDMTLDEAVSEIAQQGWLFNNCYQYDAGLWRINLRRPDGHGGWYTDWVEAPTLIDGLELCMEKLSQAEYAEDPAQSHSIDRSTPTTRTFLEGLGLVKPKAPLVRRI
jgi:hypothetical protein